MVAPTTSPGPDTLRPHSLRDVASLAQVHFTTVSRALRNDRSLPLATRQRIQSIAEQLGYRRNPFASAMMSGRRRGMDRALGHIAFVTDSPGSFPGAETHARVDESWEAARQQAEALRFSAERFCLREYNGRLPRLLDVLRHRRVAGVLLAGVAPELVEGSDFSGLAAISTCEAGNVPVLRTDHFSNVRLACMAIHAQGYRRIGVVPAPDAPCSIRDQCAAAALLATAQLGPGFEARILPPRDLDGQRESWHPDAFLTGMLNADSTERQFLYDTWHSGQEGISFRRPDLARRSVAWLVEMISRNEFGLPAHPVVVQLTGIWQHGTKVPGI